MIWQDSQPFNRMAYCSWVASVLGKILPTTFCYGSGAQGGIFLPMLVIGASRRCLFVKAYFQRQASFLLILYPIRHLCHGWYASSCDENSDFTILLVLEMTNSFSNIYAIGIVTLVAYLVAELLKEPPIYDSLLQSHDRSKPFRISANLLPN